MSNPYTADALAGLHEWAARMEPDAAMSATAIVTKALLAVAYEQRTANLLAAASAKYADGTAMFPDLMGADEGIQYEIRERLT
jgi:hypothetical protein